VKWQKLEFRVFLGVALAALLLRAYTIAIMPDAPLTDTLYHLRITQYIVENHAIPFSGIESFGIKDMPVPLFHLLTAAPFILLPVEFSLAAARVFPLIFSAAQLALSFLVLKRLFPKHWIYGFAFVAMHPLLVVFGALNYLETLASVFVLLSFYLFIRFADTGERKCLFLLPFSLAAMALSKESATALLPAFFVAVLYQLWKTRAGDEKRLWLKDAGLFAAATAFLSGFWFALTMIVAGGISTTITYGVGFLTGTKEYIGTFPVVFELVYLFPLNFNFAFWFFLAQGLESLPWLDPVLASTAFTLISFPVLMLVAFGLGKGLLERKSYAWLLLLLLAVVALMLIARRRFIRYRFLVPLLPLLGVCFALAFQEIKQADWRKLFTGLFAAMLFYSAFLSVSYAAHFQEQFSSHEPLYEFMAGLPEGSVIAINSNQTRQTEFISEKETVSSYKLGYTPSDWNASHIATTCYKDFWDRQKLSGFEEQGLLEEVYSDGCSILYRVVK
jgi:hypothetical protein